MHGVATLNEPEDHNEKEKAIQQVKQFSKKNIMSYGLQTQEKGAILEIKQYEAVQINPFYHLVSKRLDHQSLQTMLLYRPNYSNELQIIIDPGQLYQDVVEAPQHQNVKIEFAFSPPSPVDYDKYVHSL